MLARHDIGTVEFACESFLEHVVHEARLARTRYPGHADEASKWDVDVQVLQVVLGCAANPEHLAGPTAPLRDLDPLLPAQIRGRERVLALFDLGRCAGRNDLATQNTCSRSDIDEVVTCTHRLLVVLDDADRVAAIAQFLERLDQPRVVACVQADTRFVQDVEDTAQARADLGSETDAL